MARILVTSSRTPFALDAIRKLATAGHTVWAADVYASAPGSHSRYLAGHATLPSPEDDTPGFVDAVERLAVEQRIDVVLPAFEEAFYLATQHERLSKVTTLFTGDFATLARLHDKSTFQQLAASLGLPTPETVLAHSDAELRAAVERWPRWFARAAFSRGGVGLLTNTGPLAGRIDVGDVHPTDTEPWLVQPFVDGPMICTYSLVHDGAVATHMTYRAPRQWEHSTGIQFESIDGRPTLEIVSKLAAALGSTGQLSFDFVQGEDGLVLIECNPRMTDGVLLVSADQLSQGLLDPPPETVLVEPRQRIQLDFAVFAQVFREGIREVPRSFHDLVRIPDPGTGWHDHLPTLYSFLALAHHERLSFHEHKGLFESMADGMVWNGQPIAGMSAADRAVLDQLES